MTTTAELLSWPGLVRDPNATVNGEAWAYAALSMIGAFIILASPPMDNEVTDIVLNLSCLCAVALLGNILLSPELSILLLLVRVVATLLLFDSNYLLGHARVTVFIAILASLFFSAALPLGVLLLVVTLIGFLWAVIPLHVPVEVLNINLYNACVDGRVIAARYWLSRGANVNSTDDQGRTPLYIACSEGEGEGHVDVARLCLDRGANVNKADDWGRGPLHTACYDGKVATATLCLDRGADVNVVDVTGATPLLMAVSGGSIDTARLCLDRGADVDQATALGTTPLSIACRWGDVDTARLLLDRGAYVNGE